MIRRLGDELTRSYVSKEPATRRLGQDLAQAFADLHTNAADFGNTQLMDAFIRADESIALLLATLEADTTAEEEESR